MKEGRNMRNRRYRKWREVISPISERSRKRKSLGLLEKEIEKAIALGGEKREREEVKKEEGPKEAKVIEAAKKQTPGLMDFDRKKPEEREKTSPFSYEQNLTWEEKRELERKRRSLEALMNEFVNWKESLR